MTSVPPSKQQKEDAATSTAATPPPIPVGWDRCSFYVPRKNRYCRVRPLDGKKFCGNHMQFEVEDEEEQQSMGSTCKTIPVAATTTSKKSTNESSGIEDLRKVETHSESSTTSNCGTSKKRRVPCNLCHTMVYENRLAKHLTICPVTKRRKLQQNESYYRKDVNAGGSGLLCLPVTLSNDQHPTNQDDNKEDLSLVWAQNLARRVLQVHQSIFLDPTQSTNNKMKSRNVTTLEQVVENITVDQIHQCIPLVDLSQPELSKGLEHSLRSHQIRIGGTAKHVPQLASLIGHLRQMNVLPQLLQEQESDDGNTTAEMSHQAHQHHQLFLEMGAGRGMFGLTAAGVAAAAAAAARTMSSLSSNRVNSVLTTLSDHDTTDTVVQPGVEKPMKTTASETTTTSLIMVERTGTRAKAERHLRNPIPKDADTSYIKIDNIHWSRVSCDLAHVHLPTVLQKEVPSFSRNVRSDDPISTTAPSSARQPIPDVSRSSCVIAKHLCGAGTDLALKSVESIRHNVDGCIFATCCHGVCNWQMYVGRDYLREVMTDGWKEGIYGNGTITLKDFGEAEFELMRKWCAASVARNHDGEEENPASKETVRIDDSQVESSSSKAYSMLSQAGGATSISRVVKTLKLACGIQGLGRACQRLIDYGRREYLQHDIFGDRNDMIVDLCHYTPPHVSPQNVIIRAYKSPIPERRLDMDK